MAGADVDVEVVGAGVIGLTCALALARAGARVRVISDRVPADTTSAVAAAIWFPYEAAPAERVLAWSGTTLRELVRLAGDPATGVVLRGGVMCHRHPEPDLAWADEVPGHREATPDELPPDPAIGRATFCELPVVEMPTYLGWLLDQVRAAGAEVVLDRRVASLDELDAPRVVVATGLGARQLPGDPEPYAIRGQIVRVANPGIDRWILDDDNPGGDTYIIPRGRDVVLGGTADRHAEDITPDPATERSILKRALALEPRLRDQPILSRGVGLRPGRAAVRLEREIDDTNNRTIVHCYGHGGAGVTLSWGCAAEVAMLLT
jgi:D-amino-acid oxidase